MATHFRDRDGFEGRNHSPVIPTPKPASPSLPTFLTLRNRGIPVLGACPFCDEEEESTSHLLLFCPFTRANWHGTSLAVHTSDFMNCSIQQWLGRLLHIHKALQPESISYLQGIFTTLWTIWTHRNLVVHEGKNPNPLEVVLTTQSLVCRYKEAFSSCSTTSLRRSDQKGENKLPQNLWQLIIKVARARAKKLHRSGFAYEAMNLPGDVILQRTSSCTEKQPALTIQEAMLEAVIKARDLGYNFLLLLSDSRRSVLVSNRQCTPTWQERVLLASETLIHSDLVFHAVYVPAVVLSNVSSLAKLATEMPINHCMV
ncbi:uncharacterized protein LOC115984778 [Quercus lobata]|nr:uncharacterized protein LOC115984778 [Quercus lobata]